MQQVTKIPKPPARPDAGHKGTFGTVIVVGGSAAMIGAPALCARAAFRGGAGLVKLATVAEVLPYALTVEPGATGVLLEGDADAACDAIDAADPDGRAVLAVGPGLGQGDWRRAMVMRLLAGSRAVVLDADGLNALATSMKQPGDGLLKTQQKSPARILTPHPGEFRRLAEPLGITLDPTDPAQRPDAAAAFANALREARVGCDNNVVLLKGQHTVISDGGRYAINTTGNPALATAGSGDVLTGLTAALLAQGVPAFDAAQLAAHLHGRAADQWAKHHGRAGLRALDLADGIPDALNERS
ncbi:MAG: NAD(P)H-hydrate dehydratase [Phycisphaerales bacterium JB063]